MKSGWLIEIQTRCLQDGVVQPKRCPSLTSEKMHRRRPCGHVWVDCFESVLIGGLMSVALLEAVNLSDCCVTNNMEEYATKAVRLASGEGGSRVAARASCEASRHHLFAEEHAARSGRAWRRFLDYSVERARARGRALGAGDCRGTKRSALASAAL